MTATATRFLLSRFCFQRRLAIPLRELEMAGRAVPDALEASGLVTKRERNPASYTSSQAPFRVSPYAAFRPKYLQPAINPAGLLSGLRAQITSAT